MSDTRTFGSAVREYRRRAGKTQDQLAKVLDLETTYISKLEKRSPRPKPETIEGIAAALRLLPAERDELFRLAEQIPEDIRGQLVREPEPMVLLRTMGRLPADQQRGLFERFLREAEQMADTLGEAADAPVPPTPLADPADTPDRTQAPPA